MKTSEHLGNGDLTRRGFLGVSAASVAAFTADGTATPLTRIRQDWHVHTHRRGGNADAIIKDIVAANEAYGLDLMGISEHIDRIDERAEFAVVAAENHREAKAVQTKMTVLTGTESTMINPATCAVGDEIAATLDYVMVSCNHYHLEHVENPEPGTPEAYAGHYLDMLLGAAALGYVDTVGHPFFHTKLGEKLGIDGLHVVLKAYNEERLVEVLRAAAEAGMAFEINPPHAGHALEWFRDLVQEGRRHGTGFTLGTDAHQLSSLGYPGQSGRTCLDILRDLTITDADLKWAPKETRRDVTEMA